MPKRLQFDPVSVEPNNLALLADLEKRSLANIPPIPPLDLEQSRALALLIHRSPEVPTKVKEGARIMLRRSVDRLVQSMASAKAVFVSGIEKEDFVQEGLMGVLNAIELYDPNNPELERRANFATYSRYRILERMGRYRDNSDSTIRRPTHMRQLIGKIAQVERDIKTETGGHEATDEEIAELLEISPAQVKRAREARKISNVISLDKPIDEDGDATFYNRMASDDLSSEQQVLGSEERARLEEALTFLTQRQRDIVKLHFGWNRDHELTLEEIGARYDLTGQRIRQIEVKAKTRLKEILLCFNSPHTYEKLYHDLEERKFVEQAFSETDRPFLSHEFEDIVTTRLACQLGLSESRKEVDRLNTLRAVYPQYVQIVKDLGMEAIKEPHRLHAYHQARIRTERAIKQVQSTEIERPFQEGDIYAAMGVSERQGREILYRDPMLRRRVDECVAASRKGWWKAKIDKAITQIKEAYDAEKILGIDEATKLIGHNKITVYRVFKRYPDLQKSLDNALYENRRRWWRERIQFGMTLLKRSLPNAPQSPRFEDLAEKIGFGRHTLRQILDQDHEMDQVVQKSLAESVLEWRRLKVAKANLPQGKILSVEKAATAVGISQGAFTDWRKDVFLLPAGVRVGTHAQPVRKEVTPTEIQKIRDHRRECVARAVERLTIGKTAKALHVKALYSEIGISETEWYRWRAQDPGILPQGIVLVQRPQGQERERKVLEILNQFLADLQNGRAVKPSSRLELSKQLGVPSRTLCVWDSDIPAAKLLIDSIFKFVPNKSEIVPQAETTAGRRHNLDRFQRKDRIQVVEGVIQKLSQGRNLAKHPIKIAEICKAAGMTHTTLLHWISESIKEGKPVIPSNAVIFIRNWTGHEEVVTDHITRRYLVGFQMVREAKAPLSDIYTFAREWLGIATKVTVNEHIKRCPEILTAWQQAI